MHELGPSARRAGAAWRPGSPASARQGQPRPVETSARIFLFRFDCNGEKIGDAVFTPHLDEAIHLAVWAGHLISAKGIAACLN
jgi:hypothetical protein